MDAAPPVVLKSRVHDDSDALAGTSRVRCVVVDDHIMVLQLICSMLRGLAGIDVVATGTCLQDTEWIASTTRIDLVLLDPSLGDENGFTLLRSLTAAHPSLACVVISSSGSKFSCPIDLLDRVVAIVDKGQSCDALLAAIDRAVGDQLPPADRAPCRVSLRATLTQRERDIFDRIGRGLSNKEIARDCGISAKTVETHRKAISRKCDCTAASLVRLATLSRHLSLP